MSRDPRFAELDAILGHHAPAPAAPRRSLHSASGLVFLARRRKLATRDRRLVYLLETERWDELEAEGFLAELSDSELHKSLNRRSL